MPVNLSPSRTASLKRLLSRRGTKTDKSAQPAEGSSKKHDPTSQAKAAQQGAEDSPSTSKLHSPEASTPSNDPAKDHQPSSDRQGSSPQTSEKGQVPSPSQSTPPTTTSASASTSLPPDSDTMTPAVPLSDSTRNEKEKHRESSATYTLTVPLRGHHHPRKDNKSTSESTTITPERSPTGQQPKPKMRKVSFISRITSILTSCVHPSKRAHHVDLDEGATHTSTDQKDSEKQSSKLVDSAEQQPSREPSTSTTVIASPQALTIVPPPALQDGGVVVPPTPTRQLLPLSETDGLTSGAVQPPGSTGEESKQEIVQVVVGDSGEESDGSYSEDDVFTVGLRVEDLEDEEQRLINSGGTGIPTGPDGKPMPLLPPIAPQHVGRKCLVLDLDETLVHSSLKPVPSPDFIVPVEIEYNWHNFYVLKRPGVDSFLKRMGELYEVVVFTASLSKYADPVLDRLDPERTVAHRLFRESCYNHRGNYVKDLSQLGRPIGDTIIIDNSPASYIFHPHNAVPVSSWFSDVHDTELGDMTPFLADLSATADVRGILNPTI